MARSWQYARWRRIAVQGVLWAVFGVTLGVAALVVRHKRLVGPFDLGGPRMVSLPGGGSLSVRLPKGWPVDLDAGEHAGGAGRPAGVGPVVAFEAHERAGAGGTPADPEADLAVVGGRRVVLAFETVPVAVPARAYLDSSGLLSHTAALPDVDQDGEPSTTRGELAVAGVEGCWAAVAAGQPADHPMYVAVGVIPARPTPVAVTVQLDCPPGDPAGDRDLLRRVAAAVRVDRDRPPTPPSGR